MILQLLLVRERRVWCAVGRGWRVQLEISLDPATLSLVGEMHELSHSQHVATSTQSTTNLEANPSSVTFGQTIGDFLDCLHLLVVAGPKVEDSCDVELLAGVGELWGNRGGVVERERSFQRESEAGGVERGDGRPRLSSWRWIRTS